MRRAAQPYRRECTRMITPHAPVQILDEEVPFADLPTRTGIAAQRNPLLYDDGTDFPEMEGEVAWHRTSDQWELAFVAGRRMPRSWIAPILNSNKPSQRPRGWIVAYETDTGKRTGATRLLAGPLNHHSAIVLENEMDDSLGFTGSVELRPDLTTFVRWLRRTLG